MDPNEALQELREIIEQGIDIDSADRVEELFQALDEWLSTGGFFPYAWEACYCSIMSGRKFTCTTCVKKMESRIVELEGRENAAAALDFIRADQPIPYRPTDKGVKATD